jgi:type II secretory pathway pseudopilin PulG
MNIELLVSIITIGFVASIVMGLWAVFLKQAFKLPLPKSC